MPDIESCRLYTGENITCNQVTVMLVSVPSAGDDFSHTMRLDKSTAIHFRSPLYISPD